MSCSHFVNVKLLMENKSLFIQLRLYILLRSGLDLSFLVAGSSYLNGKHCCFKFCWLLFFRGFFGFVLCFLLGFFFMAQKAEKKKS